MFDLLIKNPWVIDGSGNPRFRADVAVKDGKIVRVRKCITEPAEKIIDATGLVLSPGFIDSHGHSDTVLDADRTLVKKIEQGITCEIAGMCGMSAAPLSKEYFDDCLRVCGALNAPNFASDLKTRSRFSDYMNAIDKPFGANIAIHVGHGALRAAVMGYSPKKPTPEQMKKMCDLLADAIEGGALGISFGLIYPPGAYADTDEMIELCKVIARYGADFTIHMRSESTGLIEAVEETLAVVRATGARCIISHHKATGGKANWGKTIRTVELIKEINAEGFEVYCDQYPYIASATGLNTFLPNEVHSREVTEIYRLLTTDEGRAELLPMVLGNKTEQERFGHVMIGNSQSYPHYAGRMLCDIAKELAKEPSTVLFDLLAEDKLGTGGIYFSMCEEDIEQVMSFERTMIGTDGDYDPSKALGHPRAVATFPRVLGKYVRERKVMPLEEAIRRMTGLPSQVYSLNGKGLIREGMDADMVLFDADKIIDRADFTGKGEHCEGLNYVFMAGEVAVENAVFNGKMLGKLIRR